MNMCDRLKRARPTVGGRCARQWGDETPTLMLLLMMRRVVLCEFWRRKKALIIKVWLLLMLMC